MDRNKFLQRDTCWLVEEGVFRREIDEITGIHSIVDLNMGRASFLKSGDLPCSTQRMLINIDFYDTFSFPQYVNKNGDVLKVYAPRMFIEHISGIVDKLVAGSLYHWSREFCFSLPQYMAGASNHIDFWWDTENDFYIFFGEENENLVLEAQKAMRQRHSEVEVGDWDKLSEIYSLANQDLDEEAKAFLRPKKSKLIKRLVRVLELHAQDC